MSNKTSNRTIYVPPDEYAVWESAARQRAASMDRKVSVSNLIREAMDFSLGHPTFTGLRNNNQSGDGGAR